jgi:hypothetical protein
LKGGRLDRIERQRGKHQRPTAQRLVIRADGRATSAKDPCETIAGSPARVKRMRTMT